MGTQLEYQTVVLAGLLHDIGKVIQRGRFLGLDEKGPHPHFSGLFVSVLSQAFQKVADVELLKSLVLHHHRSEQFRGFNADDITDPRSRLLAYLVNRADALSAEERGEHQLQDFRATPLAPVFARIFQVADPPPVFNFHPSPLVPADRLSREILFPGSFTAFRRGELEEAIKEFGNKAKPLLESLGANFNSFFAHLLNQLLVHTWCIPSNTQEKVPDISLFDHLKTTCAIAACLYQYCDARSCWGHLAQASLPGEPFCLVIMDVSGIQRYIFEVASRERAGGGVGKRLRARSLFVQLISEVVPLKILHSFNLPQANILMSSGGKVYTLVPNLDDTDNKLRNIEEKMDKWFLEKLHTELGTNMTWLTFGESELGKRFGDLMARAITHLGERKSHSFKRALISNGRWVTGSLLLPPFGNGQNLCPACRKFSARKDELCELCAADLEWGRSLPGAQCITISLKPSSGDRELLGAGLGIHKDLRDLRVGYDFVIHINNPDTSGLVRCPASFRYLVKHVPTDDEGVLDFETIAKRSQGRKYLAFLKADVDSLGQILAFGLRGDKEEDRRDTISRLATLSRQLDHFFTGWVQHLLQNEYEDCYAVFSGGDDLFVVGPWNQIVELAGRVRRDFADYTCHNSALTLSAGIIVVPHHYPLPQAAHDVERALEASKTHPDGKKNRLTVLGHTLTWEEWEAVNVDFIKLRGEEVSSAFLYSLLEYGKMFKAYRDGDVLGLRFQPLLAYNVSRNLRSEKAPEMHRWASRLVEWRPKNDATGQKLVHLELLAKLLILWKGG